MYRCGAEESLCVELNIMLVLILREWRCEAEKNAGVEPKRMEVGAKNTGMEVWSLKGQLHEIFELCFFS